MIYLWLSFFVPREKQKFRDVPLKQSFVSFLMFFKQFFIHLDTII